MTMRAAAIHQPQSEFRVRTGEPADLDALSALEERVFTGDRMSRRSLKHFLRSPTTSVIVATGRACIIGCAVVLFRPSSALARVYSLAVDPDWAGRGVARALLDIAAKAARGRGRTTLRLEVHVRNTRAIACYRKAGFREFDRLPRYYADKCDALRFEKTIASPTGAVIPLDRSRKTST
jgi:ribosomal protein S18 acetylase RimI-like enzyme